MKVLVKAKIGTFLIISSVLAVWMLLVAPPAQAHTPDSPSCSGLPTAEGFFTATATDTAAITPATADLTPTLTTRQGTGSAAKGGNTRYRYAKITVPQLAAGELRVFDTRPAPAASDAVLCHGTSPRASSRTSHPSSHNSAESARTSALAAQTRATTAQNNATITESAAKSALRSAAGSLRSAASALRSAISALNRAATAADAADNTAAAAAFRAAVTPATTAADAADNTASGGTPASGHAVDADTAAATPANNPTDANDEQLALGTAAGHLGTAAQALRAAANALHDTEPRVFQLRAEVMPGDQEYILVTTGNNQEVTGGADSADAPSLAVQFHGAIAAADVRRQRTLNAGDQHTYDITATAPGLLTVETTGSTDTSGMLGETVTAMDDNSGDGNNFRIVAPVPGLADGSVTYTVTVDGQTPAITGAYTLDMDFQVAMQTGLTADTGFTVPTAPIWTNTGITADDTTVQIQPRTDEDYFLLTITVDTDADNDANNSGFLTIEATDDDTRMTDAATTGTFYGPTGELATDTNSGADPSHFRIRAPVEEGVSYLVKVTGTTGVYRLTAMLDDAEGDALLTVPGAQNAPDPNADGCTTNDPAEICAPDSGESLEIERYVFEVTEFGALDVRTTGSIDTVGTLYGPDGSQIATDDNSGTNNNFRISASVGPGLHLVEVRGKERTTQGVFNLIVNFVPGAEPVDPTPTPDPDPDPDPDPTIDPNPTGSLDEPPPGGVRSGIGIIRGWACQDDGNGVQIRIMNSDGDRVATFTAPYGSDRGDVDIQEHCDRRTDGIGFAVQYNYNLLAEGTYTIEAYVGRDRVGLTPGGQTNTFRVVRISNQEFLQRVQSGRIPVENFPRTGETTILEWDQQSQNFQIVDHQ